MRTHPLPTDLVGRALALAQLTTLGRVPRLVHALVAGSLACGSDPPVDTQLSVAAEYVSVGVVRVSNAGATALRPFRFELSSMLVSGSKASAKLEGVGSEIELTGYYDGAEHLVVFELFDAAVTSTATESIAGLGMKLTDGKPSNGIADEISGFVEGHQGQVTLDGSFLGVSRRTVRIDPPQPDQLSAARSGLGEIEVMGGPGTIHGPIGVELYRFTSTDRNPVLTTARANDDGSFRVTLEGVPGDVVVVRANAAGVPSFGEFVAVPE
ncbi:MAG: hypothetical protein HY791_35625 [Deltaproteobacteria bacterium]|nr:hypothetical protein [Deltaproteobacteria bacterium]